jgi:long-chain acyl-CoA synthetase
MEKFINPKKNTIYYFLKQAVERNQERICQNFRNSNKDIIDRNYKEFYNTLEQISSALISIGCNKEDKVGLIADSGPNFLLLALSINSIGAVDVPRGTDATKEDLLYILNHTNCRFLFLENKKAFEKIERELTALKSLEYILFFNKENVQPISKIKILSLEELINIGKSNLNSKLLEERGDSIKPEDLCTIIYTSGTTGVPKGVMLSHNNFVWMAMKLEEALRETGLEFQGDETTLGYLPPWHIGDRIFETGCFGIGVLVAFTTIPNLASDLKRVNPTLLFSVPRVWENFYNKIWDSVNQASAFKKIIFKFSTFSATKFTHHVDNLLGRLLQLEKKNLLQEAYEKVISLFYSILLLFPYLITKPILKKVREALGSKIRFAFSGAGALPYHIDRFFYSIGIPILETYGMTETTAVSCLRAFNRPVIGTLGKTLSEIEIKLVDEKGNIVKQANTKGVAHHKGQHIMMGYYKDEEKTKATISSDGFLNSGDILIYTQKGELKFAGRAKDTIVLLGGENVEPEPIEFILVQSDFIHQVMVVGQDKKTLGALLVPNFEKTVKFLSEKNISIPEQDKWNQDNSIRELFKNEIKIRISNNKSFKSFEKVSNFCILPKEFEVGKELTQTLKLKRNVVTELYKNEIEELYK